MPLIFCKLSKKLHVMSEEKNKYGKKLTDTVHEIYICFLKLDSGL